jgi:arylsulfatase A-like enzyme
MSENSHLAFSLGFHPETVRNAEAVTFSVFVKKFDPDDSDPGEEVFRTTLNPKANKSERTWQDYEVDLSEYTGEVLTISFNIMADVNPLDVICGWANPRIYSRIEKPKYNIFFITMDALRPDHMSTYGYRRKTTPHLDEFAKESVLYTNCNSSAPWTLPSFASIYTSLFPQNHRVYKLPESGFESYVLLKFNFPTIPRFFKPYGYRSYLITTHPYLYDADYRLNRSFDVVEEDRMNLEKPLFIDSFEYYLEDIEDERFFLHIHLLPPHEPFFAVSPYDDRYLDYDYDDVGARNAKLLFSWPEIKAYKNEVKKSNRDYIIDLYDTSLATADEYFGEFVALLKERGMYDESIIIFSADHGEQFWEHNNIGHSKSLHWEEIHVPLIIKYPKSLGVEPDEIDDPVLTIDVLPTMLAANAISIPDYLDGEPLIESDRTKTRSPEREYSLHARACSIQNFRGIIWENYKYIYYEGTQYERLYDISRDPREKKDITAKKPEIAKKLRDILLSHEEPEESTAPKKTDEIKDDEALNRLKDLGYMQ